MIDNRYSDLMASYFSGNISAEDQKQLLDWVAESDANQTLFEESRMIWSLAGEEEPDFEVDIDQAWAAVAPQLDQTPVKALPSKQSKRWSIGPYLLRIAAVILLAVAAGYWFFPPQPAPPQLYSVVTQTGQTQELTLPDGSKVWVNEQSTLSYYPDFKPRKILLEGEAFFEVENLNDETFEILSGEARTVVLGTAFNVRAYPKENQIEVTVEHGKVAVDLNEKKTQPILLKAGNTGVLDKTSKDLVKKAQKTVNATSWKTKSLTFDNMKMGEVIESLERYFGITIDVSDERILNCHFTGNYQNPELKQILDVLQFGMNLEIDQQTTQYRLTGEGCRK
ncbi:MAG: FecR domain-containing protein [Bacteroidota bacterium]